MNEPYFIYETPIAQQLVYNAIGTYFPGELISNVFIPYNNMSTVGMYPHGCRETFQSGWLRAQLNKNSAIFGIAVSTSTIISEFRRFISMVEDKLNIKDSIKLFPTRRNTFVIVQLGEYWVKSKIRQEFVTILLRCYSSWKETQLDKTEQTELNLEQILFTQKYFNETKEAVRYFLEGHTAMKKPFKADIGWYKRFAQKIDNSNPNEVLVGLLNDGVVVEIE